MIALLRMRLRLLCSCGLRRLWPDWRTLLCSGELRRVKARMAELLGCCGLRRLRPGWLKLLCCEGS